MWYNFNKYHKSTIDVYLRDINSKNKQRRDINFMTVNLMFDITVWNKHFYDF